MQVDDVKPSFPRKVTQWWLKCKRSGGIKHDYDREAQKANVKLKLKREEDEKNCKLRK